MSTIGWIAIILMSPFLMVIALVLICAICEVITEFLGLFKGGKRK